MQKVITILTPLLLSLLYISAASAHIYSEKEYQSHWCYANKGKTEVRLADRTRIDCLTDEYAIEFDFANKWAESVGQSLYYAHCTGKNAGIVLILENPKKDLKYLQRLKYIAEKHNIKIWTITPQDLHITGRCGQNQNF